VPSPRLRHLGLTLAVAAAVAACVPLTADAASERLIVSPRLELQVAQRVNAVRRWHGLRPLRLARGLKASARSHSRDMALRGYFEHESANGAQFWSRIERFYGSRGYGRWEVGENILWQSGRAPAAEIVREWMGSPGHRENLLSGAWRELGLGALRVSRAGGAYGGRNVTIITLDFGVRVR
jgi:uncharacterized protein YkwD